jgi:CPA1 family monovalent cation:H+ antiporter
VLIGLEVLLLAQEWNYILAGVLAIPAVLLARFIAVGLPMVALGQFIDHLPHNIKLMTWGGLRGGISVALALSLRDFLKADEPAITDALLVMTYVVVAFSIIVQGLTMGPMIQRLLPKKSDFGGDGISERESG